MLDSPAIDRPWFLKIAVLVYFHQLSMRQQFLRPTGRALPKLATAPNELRDFEADTVYLPLTG